MLSLSKHEPVSKHRTLGLRSGNPRPARDVGQPKATERMETMAKEHGPQIKDDERYEALRREGASKEKAARIANKPRKKAAKIGRAACRERVCQYGYISGVAVSLKKKKKTNKEQQIL